MPGQRDRARAAQSNRSGRYELHHREAFSDDWEIAHEPQLVKTEVRLETPQSAITRNQSPDIPFDRSLNPYRGCEHGCIYCYARPTHAWLNLSPGLDFETKLIARPGIGAQLDRELRAKSYKVAPLALGTNTDPYQPIEAKYRVMREVLEVLDKFNHPVTITTKGTLIERDLDLLAPMAARGLVSVGISITTLDAHLSRQMEPRVAVPERRLQTLKTLSEAGIPCRIMVSPVIPGLTDHELEAILTAGHEAGARYASWILLRLPLEVAPLFREWLETYAPNKATKVLQRLHDSYGGQDYDPQWGKRFRGEGVWPRLIGSRFSLTCKRLSLSQADLEDLRHDLFCPPFAIGAQLGLF